MALKTLRGIAASRKLLQGVLFDESKAKAGCGLLTIVGSYIMS